MYASVNIATATSTSKAAAAVAATVMDDDNNTKADDWNAQEGVFLCAYFNSQNDAACMYVHEKKKKRLAPVNTADTHSYVP